MWVKYVLLLCTFLWPIAFGVASYPYNGVRVPKLKASSSILSMHKDLYVSLLTQLLLCTVQLFFEKITRVINPQDVCVFWSKSFYGILSFVVSPTVHRASNSLLPRHDKWHVTMHSFWFFYISFTAHWGSILGCPLYSDLHVSFVIFFRFLLSKLGLYSYIKMFSVWVDLFLL